MKGIHRLLTKCLPLLLLTLLFPLGTQAGGTTVVVSPQNASWTERLAAQEVRRYLYIRTGHLPRLTEDRDSLAGGQAIYVARKDRAFLQNVLGSPTA